MLEPTSSTAMLGAIRGNQKASNGFMLALWVRAGIFLKFLKPEHSNDCYVMLSMVANFFSFPYLHV